MPATARFCPNCGYANANADASDDAALTSSEGSAMVQPPVLDTGGPTIDISNGRGLSYTPPAPAGTAGPAPGAWQPEEYNSGSVYTPPAQNFAPQVQPQYAPPPQYPQTQSFQQQGMQMQPPAQRLPEYSQAPLNYQYQPQVAQVGLAGTSPRDPTIALLLELLGYIGFLGIGHIYAGRTARGIALLVGWWVYVGVSAVLTILLIGCLMLFAGLAVPILSGLWIKSDLDRGRVRG